MILPDTHTFRILMGGWQTRWDGDNENSRRQEHSGCCVYKTTLSEINALSPVKVVSIGITGYLPTVPDCYI